MFLAWRDPRTLAVAHERDEGLVSTWTFEDDRLAPLGAASGTGAGVSPCHVAFAPSGEHVFAANYGGSRLSLHEVQPEAALVAAIDFTGTGPHDGRQDAPHPHHWIAP
jgi:6-phosphogluconolactonase (cycloisomerase 2 family)